MDPAHEQFVRLLVLEEIVELSDFMDGLKRIRDPGEIGHDLIEGLFDESGDDESTDDAPDEPDPSPTQNSCGLVGRRITHKAAWKKGVRPNRPDAHAM